MIARHPKAVIVTLDDRAIAAVSVEMSSIWTISASSSRPGKTGVRCHSARQLQPPTWDKPTEFQSSVAPKDVVCTSRLSDPSAVALVEEQQFPQKPVAFRFGSFPHVIRQAGPCTIFPRRFEAVDNLFTTAQRRRRGGHSARNTQGMETCTNMLHADSTHCNFTHRIALRDAS